MANRNELKIQIHDPAHSPGCSPAVLVGKGIYEPISLEAAALLPFEKVDADYHSVCKDCAKERGIVW